MQSFEEYYHVTNEAFPDKEFIKNKLNRHYAFHETSVSFLPKILRDGRLCSLYVKSIEDGTLDHLLDGLLAAKARENVFNGMSYVYTSIMRDLDKIKWYMGITSNECMFVIKLDSIEDAEYKEGENGVVRIPDCILVNNHTIEEIVIYEDFDYDDITNTAKELASDLNIPLSIGWREESIMKYIS